MEIVHLNHFDGTNGLDFANGGTSGRWIISK